MSLVPWSGCESANDIHPQAENAAFNQPFTKVTAHFNLQGPPQQLPRNPGTVGPGGLWGIFQPRGRRISSRATQDVNVELDITEIAGDFHLLFFC